MIKLRQSASKSGLAVLSSDVGTTFLTIDELRHLLSDDFRREIEAMIVYLDPAGACERASERMRLLREQINPSPAPETERCPPEHKC